MKKELNKQENEDFDNSFEEFLAELCAPPPPPSEEQLAQQKRKEEELHEKVLAISKKYNISEERIDKLSNMIYAALGYIHSLCNNRIICVVEKKWGYKESSVLFGFIVNIRKCIDVTRNEIIIEIMYADEKVSLFKINLDDPTISKAFRERYNDVFLLRSTVGSNLVVLHLCNKKLKNGEVFSTVKRIELFTDDEMDTLFSMNDFTCDDYYIKMRRDIYFANKRDKDKLAQKIEMIEKREIKRSMSS